jgi:hypothetical protein
VESTKIIAEERVYLAKNEPTFYQEDANGNYFIGKVGRMPTGEDIRISVTFPEFYPFEKPEITVITPMEHPNIDQTSNKLDLEILEFWDPKYRVKDVLSAIRRLFVKSQVKPLMRKSSIVEIKSETGSPNRGNINNLQNEIFALQQNITDMNQKIQREKENALLNQGFDLSRSVKTTPKMEIRAELQAVDDLLELLEIKFEEAEINTVEFARLYRRYSASRFILQHELEILGDDVKHELQNKKEAEIRN